MFRFLLFFACKSSDVEARADSLPAAVPHCITWSGQDSQMCSDPKRKAKRQMLHTLPSQLLLRRLSACFNKLSSIPRSFRDELVFSFTSASWSALRRVKRTVKVTGWFMFNAFFLLLIVSVKGCHVRYVVAKKAVKHYISHSFFYLLYLFSLSRIKVKDSTFNLVLCVYFCFSKTKSFISDKHKSLCWSKSTRLWCDATPSSLLWLLTGPGKDS